MPIRSARALVETMRPKQWIKNLIVFGPLIFSRHLFEAPKILEAAAAFALFSLSASVVYLVNDLADIERDRAHPKKKHRPLPSGRLQPWQALAAALLLGPGGLIAAAAVSPALALVLFVYVAMNLGYSLGLKNVVLIDVMFLASGFVLRVLGGAFAINVPPSEWLVMCTMLLASFLGFAKRRHELVLMENDAASHRKVLSHYSPELLDQLILISTACTLMSYALYTVSPATTARVGSSALMYTVPFVMYGVFRYLYLVHKHDEGGDPTRVFFTDRPLIVDILLWVVASTTILYAGGAPAPAGALP